MYISRTREGLNKEFGIFILRSTVLKMEFILFETTSKMASNKRMWYQPKYKFVNGFQRPTFVSLRLTEYKSSV